MNKILLIEISNSKFYIMSIFLERQVHFVRHHVKQGRIVINFVKSKDQLADVLTKPLPPQKFREMRDLTTLELCKNPSNFIPKE